MSEAVREALADALGGPSVRDYLSSCLAGEREVFDEGTSSVEGGGLQGLPPGRYSRAAMLSEKKREARMADRLSPGVTVAEREKKGLEARLREAEWDFSESPGRDAEFAEMDAELDELRGEAGLDGLDGMEAWERYGAAVRRYNEVREGAVEGAKAARVFLEKDDLRRAEESVSRLEESVGAMAGRYEEVVAAFDALCGALCSVIDGRDESRRVTMPGLRESERNGVGMVDGEDGAAYARRMGKLGRGRDVPSTIRGYDKVVEGCERRWRSVAGLSFSDFVVVKENWRATVRELMRTNFAGSIMKVAGFNAMMERGLDYGGYEVGRGVLQPSVPFGGAGGFGIQYGDVVVRWKPSCMVATVLFDDGLSVGRNGHDYVSPSFITNPSPCSFGPEDGRLVKELLKGPLRCGLAEVCRMADVPYAEVEFHGGDGMYGADAVEAVYFRTEADARNVSAEAAGCLSRRMVSLYAGGRGFMFRDGEIEYIDGEEG